jgi:hypothetical protein
MFANNMSLINDALRKARKTQPEEATANGPDLLPVDAGARTCSRSIITLPFIIAVVLVLASVLLWAWYRAGRGELVVRGNSNPASVTAAPQASEPTASTEKPTSATTIASAPAVATRVDAGSTNILLAATEAPRPAAPVYKLEGIFYNPKKPTAVINGDLVYVGSRVEEGRVVAIDEESATVVTSAGETNLLVLTR